MKLLLIGNGAWAQNYKKIIPELDVCTYDWEKKFKKYDGVIVCTPPQTHIQICKKIMGHGIPVMVEKPLSLSKDIHELKKYNSPILVNYIHLFSERYQFIKNNVQRIDFISSIGCGFNDDRNYSSLYDYGVHDLSMILDLSSKMPNLKTIKQYNKLYYINLKFSDFETNSIIGNGALEKIRYFNANGLVYDGLNSKENILKKAIDVFISKIQGGDDYRFGLDLSLKINDILF